MIEEWAERLGAKVDRTSDIDYGKQYRLSRGKETAIVNVYQGKAGTKVVVQQKGPLADALRELASAGKVARSSPWSEWCGTDESGKGDYFGPLAVAGVAVTAEQAAELSTLGVRDSKTLSEAGIAELDRRIRKTCAFKLSGIMPAEYNERYEKLRNVNRLLGELHGGAIASLVEARPGIQVAVTDRFGDESYVEYALSTRGCGVKLIQRPKADETDVAVAAASVIARAAFVRGLAKAGREAGMTLPAGAGPEVVEAARALVRARGRDALRMAAKLHFRTTAQI